MPSFASLSFIEHFVLLRFNKVVGSNIRTFREWARHPYLYAGAHPSIGCLRSLRSLSFCLIDLLRIIRQGCIEVFLRQSSSHCFNGRCIVWVGNHAIKI